MITLEEHLEQEATAERRSEMIEVMAQDTMQQGGKYYPYTKENLGEALQNCSDGYLEKLAEALGTAARQPGTLHLSSTSIHDALVVQHLQHFSEAYWKDVAIYHAAKEYDNFYG